MKSESTDDKMCEKCYNLTEEILQLVEKVKSLANENVFDNQKIIEKCQQINTRLNQIEVLKDLINPDDLTPDPLKSTPCLN